MPGRVSRLRIEGTSAARIFLLRHASFYTSSPRSQCNSDEDYGRSKDVSGRQAGTDKVQHVDGDDKVHRLINPKSLRPDALMGCIQVHSTAQQPARPAQRHWPLVVARE